MTKKSPENGFFAKGNNSCKSRSNATKVKLDLYNVKPNPYTKFQVNISKDDWEKFGKPSGRTPSGLTDGRTDRLTDGRTDRQTDRMTDGEETYEISSENVKRWQRKVRKMNFLQRAITHVKVGETRRKSNLTCIMSRQIHIWSFNSIRQKMTKKSPENGFFAKGNNSCKSRSNATKVKLDLYNVKPNPYTKFQVNISKDDWEKFGKPSGRTPSGLTDGRTDRLTDGRTDRQTDRMTDGEETYSPPPPPVSPVGD